MAKKRKAKDDEQIVALLDQHIRFTTGYADSALMHERTRVLEYYDGVLPRPHSKGNSKYVSQDVFEEVESSKATILETFCTNTHIVEFTPDGANDVELARIATEYCAWIVWQDNDGQTILGNVLTDGFLARNGVCKVSWEEEETEEDSEVGPASMDELAAHPDIKDENTKVNSLDDHQDGTYTAHISKKSTRGHPELNAIPPEDFGITARAKSIKKSKLCYDREAMTKSMMYAQFDPKLVDQCAADNLEFLIDQEKAARFELLDTQRVLTDDTEDLENNRTYTVYHCFAKLDVEGTGIERLWYVCKCGNIILDKMKVAARPYVSFCPLPKPHSFYGNSFATKVIPLQNAKTVLTRAILDHAAITNAPRWQVVKGGLMNPKELMDTRVGGLVNVTRPDAVSPLEQANLNPFVFQTLQLMDTTKEDVTGTSRLSKGLNRDAISTQNSTDLVEDLVSLADRRQKIIARQFAQFIKELYLLVYQLVIDHQDYQVAMQVAGNWVTVDPTQWRARTLVEAQIAVGYGEQDKEAQKLIGIDTYMGNNPRFQAMYTAQNQYNVAVKALQKQGIKDINTYLTPPNQWKPPQPDPKMQAEVQEMQSRAKAEMITAQVALERVQFEREKWRAEQALKERTELAKQTIASDALSLKERQALHDERVDEAEIKLQQEELKMQPTLTAMSNAHPNG